MPHITSCISKYYIFFPDNGRKYCLKGSRPHATLKLELHLGGISKSFKMSSHGLVHWRGATSQYLQYKNKLSASVSFQISANFVSFLSSENLNLKSARKDCLIRTWISAAGAGQWVWIISLDTNPTPSFHTSGGYRKIKTSNKFILMMQT